MSTGGLHFRFFFIQENLHRHKSPAMGLHIRPRFHLPCCTHHPISQDDSMISQFRAKKKQPVKRKSGQPKPTAHLYKPSAHPVPILRMEWRSGALPGLKPPIGDQAGDEGNYKYAGAAIDDRGEGERDFCQESNHGNNSIQGKDDGEDHCRIPLSSAFRFLPAGAQAPVGPALDFIP